MGISSSLGIRIKEDTGAVKDIYLYPMSGRDQLTWLLMEGQSTDTVVRIPREEVLTESEWKDLTLKGPEDDTIITTRYTSVKTLKTLLEKYRRSIEKYISENEATITQLNGILTISSICYTLGSLQAILECTDSKFRVKLIAELY